MRSIRSTRGVANASPRGDLRALDAEPGRTMRFVNDHDPLPLLGQLQARYGDEVSIEYRQRRPGAIAIDFIKLSLSDRRRERGSGPPSGDPAAARNFRRRREVPTHLGVSRRNYSSLIAVELDVQFQACNFQRYFRGNDSVPAVHGRR
jgi:hypothetical protein